MASPGAVGEATPADAANAAKAALKDARLEEARPINNKPIPPVPQDLGLDPQGLETTTLVLFYQYVEPPWSGKQHKAALRFIMDLGRKNKVSGRGRCAQEGLNCTMTGPADGVRAFCQGLRDWNPIFEQTDFKFTDGLDNKKRFKALTVRKVDELVAYGLEGAYAPSLHRNAAHNLEADEYHEMMADPSAVIIDVRNVYESAIGHFQPPAGGAELIVPPVRHSFEFPRWFNDPDTKEKLKDKKVMMYCTGGIRCERATALLDQIEKTGDDDDGPAFSTQGIYHCRGGIERYMKTFPTGGFWKGRNYLFDRRLEQVPELKTRADIDKDVESWCSVCGKAWGQYRGAKTCSVQECKIPVIVCPGCQTADPHLMKCPMCASGDRFQLRKREPPRLINAENATFKRKALDQGAVALAKRLRPHNMEPSTRLFVGKVPLTVTAQAISDAIGCEIKTLHWITDQDTGFFYGSTWVEVENLRVAAGVIDKATTVGIKMGKRRLRITYSALRSDETWPPAGHQHRDRPPIPVG